MVNGIQAGDLDLALDDGPINIVAVPQASRRAARSTSPSRSKFPELSYTLFNVTKAPFNNKNARLAFAYAVDRVQQNKLRNKDVCRRWPAVRSGPA